MKVLHVSPGLAQRVGGPAVVVIEAARALEQLGDTATVFAPDMADSVKARSHRRLLPADLPAGADALDIRLFTVRPPRRVAFSPALYRALNRHVRRYDVVHIHSLFLFPHFAAFAAARRYGVPYVVSPHGALAPPLRERNRLAKAGVHFAWQRAMLEQAATIHYATDDERLSLADLGLGAPEAVVPVGIRCDAFVTLPDGDGFRRRFLSGHSGTLILNVGRLSEKKGLDILITAFAQLATTVPDSCLVIVGPDDEGLGPSLRALAETLGVGRKVVFTGLLTGHDKLSAMAAADLWVLSSHTENFGLAVMEALAAGLPVIVSPGVNLAPHIRRADAGVVCALTHGAVAAAMLDLLRDPARRAALGLRARSFAQQFDWRRVAPAWADMYAHASIAGRSNSVSRRRRMTRPPADDDSRR